MLVATVGCWIAVLQKRKAKEQMERMMKDMKILQQAEDGLQELQTRYLKYNHPFNTQAVHLILDLFSMWSGGQDYDNDDVHLFGINVTFPVGIYIIHSN